MRLCLASGSEEIKIEKGDSAFAVVHGGSTYRIERRSASGLVGGISKDLTAIGAQQATEARSCTRLYLKTLVDMIMSDSPGSGSEKQRQSTNQRGSVFSDPASFWGGEGLWADSGAYCAQLVDFVDAAANPQDFVFSDTRRPVTLEQLTSRKHKIEGNFFVRTEDGSTAQFCGVYHNEEQNYDALACSRVVVSNDRPEVLASVFNQTLKDIRDCLLPRKWKQTSTDQGACIPRGSGGNCIRRFEGSNKILWLFSNREADNFSIGIQTELGPR